MTNLQNEFLVGEFCRVSSGGTPNTSNPNYWENGQIPWMSSGEVHKKRIKETKGFITNEGLSNSSAKIFPKDTILVALAGQGKTRGVVAISEIELSTNQSVAGIIPEQTICLPEFLYYNLGNRYQELRSESGGSGRAGLNLSIISNLKIKLPTLPEQKKIAKILSEMDHWISLLDKKIEKLQLLFHAQRHELLEQRSNWDEYKISEIADPSEKYSLTGGPFGSDLKVSDYVERGIRIIQLQNIGDSIFNDTNKVYTSIQKADSLLSSNIFGGDLIIAKMGDPVAKCTVIPNYLSRCLMSSDGIRLKINQKKFDNFFIELSINSPYFRKKTTAISTGTTRQRIGLELFRNLTIACPNIDEQRKISRILLSLKNVINGLIQQQFVLRNIKIGLSSDLFSGHIRVN